MDNVILEFQKEGNEVVLTTSTEYGTGEAIISQNLADAFCALVDIAFEEEENDEVFEVEDETEEYDEEEDGFIEDDGGEDDEVEDDVEDDEVEDEVEDDVEDDDVEDDDVEVEYYCSCPYCSFKFFLDRGEAEDEVVTCLNCNEEFELID